MLMKNIEPFTHDSGTLGQGGEVSGFERQFEEMTVLFLKCTDLFPVAPLPPSRWLVFGKHLKTHPPKVSSCHLALHS